MRYSCVDFSDIGSKVGNTYSHYYHSTYLSYGISRKSHQQGKYGTTKESHNHQSAYFVFLFRYGE